MLRDQLLTDLARDRGGDLTAFAYLLTGDRAAAQDLVRAALAALSPQERATVVLRYYDDLSLAEVAQRMGLAVGTVKRYASNALHELEATLGPIRQDVDAVDVLPAHDATARRS